jgi:hypothetical protein
MSTTIFDAGDLVCAESIIKENAVFDKDNVYAYNGIGGVGCSTVWFNSVPACRAYLRINGKLSLDSGLCEKCRCHYSAMDKRYNMYPDFACKKYKAKITLEADKILKKHPILGRKKITKEMIDKILV